MEGLCGGGRCNTKNWWGGKKQSEMDTDALRGGDAKGDLYFTEEEEERGPNRKMGEAQRE